MKDKKVPEYVTMRKETVDLSIRSWLCSTQVGSSLDVNLGLVVNCLEMRLINLIYKCPFMYMCVHTMSYMHVYAMCYMCVYAMSYMCVYAMCYRCPTYDNLPSQCRMVPDTANPCCNKPECSFATQAPGTGGQLPSGTVNLGNLVLTW